MKRRKFLHSISHVSALAASMPSFAFSDFNFDNNSYLSNTESKGNILVLIKLSGGNDGLNTLIPLDKMSQLSKARPHVLIPDNKIVNMGSKDLGLHPSVKDFRSFFDENRLKIIQNVGYEQPDFSHFRSMDIWQSASDYDQYLNSGWLGRYIENRHAEYPNNYPNPQYPHPLSVELGWQSSLLFTGENSFTSFIANNPTDFREIINEFDNVYPSDKQGEKLKYIQLIAKQSNLYSKEVKKAYESSSTTHAYPNTNLGDQLEIASRLIEGGLNTRIYMVELGGFDTHDSQVDTSDKTKGEHAFLLKDLNDSITAFIKNLDAIGRSDDVLTMTFSEFGRTIVSNGSNGTDHGTAAPMFIFGNKVNPEILGKNPLIPDNAAWQDNLAVEFDYRQVYKSIINQWLGGDSTTAKDVLFKDFYELSIAGDEYVDTDGDGVADINDNCPDTPEGSVVDLNGCVLFSLPVSNYSVKTVSASCIGSNNGKIAVSASNTSYTYQLGISGVETTYSLSSDNEHTILLEDLEVGIYTINISIAEQEGYLQSFEAKISEPDPLQGKAQIDYFSKSAQLNLSGSEVYYVEVNGVMMASHSNYFSAPLKAGKNVIKVTTPLDCQGVFEEVLFLSEKLRYFPNPVASVLNITIPGTDEEIALEIFSDSGSNLYRGTHKIGASRTIQLPMGRFKSGLYIVTGIGKTVNESFKVIKL